MPHRHQDYSELCSVCRAATQDACPRCQVPLCAEHRPSWGQRCAACEAEYAEEIAGLPVPAGRSPLFRVTMGVGLGSAGLAALAMLISVGAGNLLRNPLLTAIVLAILMIPGGVIAGGAYLLDRPGRKLQGGTRRLLLSHRRRRFLRQRKRPAMLPAPSAAVEADDPQPALGPAAGEVDLERR